MSDQFLAEIRIFPFPFAPAGWAMCNGQILPISQASSLFSLLGSTYGGNAITNFALPDFEGNVPVCTTNASHPLPPSPPLNPALSPYDMGQFGGGQTFTLNTFEIPVHNHLVEATTAFGTTADAKGMVMSRGQYVAPDKTKGAIQIYNTAQPGVTLHPQAIGPAGGGQPHNNMMPYLTLNFCIALTGIFPQRQ
jgi:microcystin-dependent protein